MVGMLIGNTTAETFNSFIVEEVFGRQPMKIYARRSSQSLMKNGLNIFLEYRTNTLNGANGLVPSIIGKAVSQIMKMTDEVSTDARAEYIRKAAIVFHLYSERSCKMISQPSRHTIECAARDSDDAMLLCLAAGMRDPLLVWRILEQSTVAWNKTFFFGYPIKIAIRANDIHTAKIFLDTLLTRGNTIIPSIILPIITSRLIYGKIITCDPAMTTQLISSYCAAYGRPDENTCSQWFDLAFLVKKFDIVESIIGMGFIESLAVRYRDYWFRISSSSNNSVRMRLLLKLKVLEPNTRYTFGSAAFHKESLKSESLLNYSVRIGDEEAVKVLLEAGADPRGVQGESPINTALTNDRCLPMILGLLLAYASKTDSKVRVRDLVLSADLRLARRRNQKLKMLEAAFERTEAP